ncbi:MAG: hypothetical protein WCS21_10545 [Lachnospiraceae bacterium]
MKKIIVLLSLAITTMLSVTGCANFNWDGVYEVGTDAAFNMLDARIRTKLATLKTEGKITEAEYNVLLTRWEAGEAQMKDLIDKLYEKMKTDAANKDEVAAAAEQVVAPVAETVVAVETK